MSNTILSIKMKTSMTYAVILAIATSIPIEVNGQINDVEDLVSAYGDEDIISLATGRSQPISRAPAVATVITAKEIEEMGATNLDQVLETVPGIHMSLSSIYLDPIISIRGIHTDVNPQVLMLVNGIPITQVYLGDRGIRSTLPVASIERVEVVRGPGSAIFGADAFAGVINVITKDAANINGTEGGIRYGSFDTKDAWALHGSKWGELDLAFTVEYHRAAGDDDRIIRSDSQSLFDSALGTNVSLAPGPMSTGIKRSDIRLDLSYRDWRLRAWNWHQSDVRVGPGLAQALDPSGKGESDNYLVDLTFHNPDLTENWDLTGRFSYMGVNLNTQQRLFPAGTVLPIGKDGNLNPIKPAGLVLFNDGLKGNPGRDEDHFRLDLTGFYTGFDYHRLRFSSGVHYVEVTPNETKNFGPGVIDSSSLLPPPALNFDDGNVTDVTGTPFIYVKPEQRTVYYASIQDEWSFASNWNLTTGVRFDHYSDFGDTINPRLALVWDARHDVTTKFLYGRAFRAPSFAELFAINNPVVLGNPELDPEIINTLELAFDYRPTFDLRTGLNLFAYKVDDLIRFVPDPGATTTTAQNVGSQEGYGLELETEWKLTSDFILQGNYAFQNSEDTDTNTNAGNAPMNQIYLIGKWKFLPDWLFSTSILWVGDRHRVIEDPRPNIDDYTTVNLTLRKKNIIRGLSGALLVHNLFDEKAFEPSPTDPSVPSGSLVPGNYPLSGRYISGELQYRF
jgi:outer membrane receptor for ferrienterochelin and colicins